jgi:septal ring factor EnvC (AmiA/AmiB activator)
MNFRLGLFPLILWAGATGENAHAATLRERLSAEAAFLEKEIARLESQRGTFLSELDFLEKQERLLRLRVEELAGARRENEAQAAELETDIAAKERERAEVAAQLEKTLRALYVLGPPRSMQWLASGEDPGRALRACRYMAYLGESQAELSEKLARLQAELSARKGELDEARREIERLRLAAEERRAELAQRRKDIRVLVERLDSDRALSARAASELERARDLLENFLAAAESTGALSGLLNVESFRGLLPPPVDGAVLEGFGTIMHPRFKTRVPHHGLSFRVRRGEKVRCVFDGTVLFAGWFEGYGQTLIIDHGHGYHSVYAHNDELLKREGDAAMKGEAVALAGETGSLRGLVLYFEFRRGSEALDPRPWLKPSS